jgi:N-acyl-D-aspartate/D-glutamate deacylase
MADIVREGLQAGALGISTAHTLLIKSTDGSSVPGALAQLDELFGIAAPLGELGVGVFQCMPAGTSVPEPKSDGRVTCYESEWAWMKEISIRTGRPVTFTHVQSQYDATAWRRGFEYCDRSTADGAQLYPQIHPRGPGFMVSLQTIHPFQYTPTYSRICSSTPAVTAARMRDPATKADILAEVVTAGTAKLIPAIPLTSDLLARMFPLGDSLDYEQLRDVTPLAIAERTGRDAIEVLYDMLCDGNGERFLYLPLVNYIDYSYDVVAQMLAAERSIVGLSDAGAHCGVMCDASNTTFLLTYWTRDRQGERMPVELAIKKITSELAHLVGLRDRGVLRPGAKADVNVIDYAALKLCTPEILRDLPAGAHRLIQRAEGYDCTIVSGRIIMRDGVDTGERPGKLVRGAQIFQAPPVTTAQTT